MPEKQHAKHEKNGGQRVLVGTHLTLQVEVDAENRAGAGLGNLDARKTIMLAESMREPLPYPQPQILEIQRDTCKQAVGVQSCLHSFKMQTVTWVQQQGKRLIYHRPPQCPFQD